MNTQSDLFVWSSLEYSMKQVKFSCYKLPNEHIYQIFIRGKKALVPWFIDLFKLNKSLLRAEVRRLYKVLSST